jgi:hypothetical protein
MSNRSVRSSPILCSRHCCAIGPSDNGDAAAARADQAVRFDDLFNARQSGRQIADGALWRGLGCYSVTCFGRQIFFLCLDFAKRNRQIFKRQLARVFSQFF